MVDTVVGALLAALLVGLGYIGLICYRVKREGGVSSTFLGGDI